MDELRDFYRVGFGVLDQHMLAGEWAEVEVILERTCGDSNLTPEHGIGLVRFCSSAKDKIENWNRCIRDRKSVV